MNAASLPRPGWSPAAAPVLSRLQRHWLARPGALTTGLRALGAFELRVLAEYAAAAPAEEARGMGIAPATPVWIREIVMSVDGLPSVVARSLTPLRDSHGVWQGMRRLRTRPLADMLYHDRSVSRSAFETARLHAALPLHGVAKRLCGDAGGRRLLARRSVFRRQGRPLLVEECFLPGFWAKAASAFYRREAGARGLGRQVR